MVRRNHAQQRPPGQLSFLELIRHIRLMEEFVSHPDNMNPGTVSEGSLPKPVTIKVQQEDGSVDVTFPAGSVIVYVGPWQYELRARRPAGRSVVVITFDDGGMHPVCNWKPAR